jgi:O-acetyl-ADP-ribose deacetylase (regulator of RNase III)
VCSSSKVLLENVFKVGGDTVKTAYNSQSNQNQSTVIAVPAGRQLLSKQIYFLPWQPNSDEAELCKSLKKFVSNAIEKAVSENYQSIAFPAIGCGQFGCPIKLVAKTLITEAHRLLETHAISVSFIIQPDRVDIYDEFQKQIDLLEQSQQPPGVPPVCVSIGKGMIVVEKGNITTQKVRNEE